MVKNTKRRKKIIWIIAGSFLLILIAARIALPYILLRFVNHELTKINGYTGHVEDIDVALFRGAYTLEETKLEKTGGKVPVPFFYAPVIDLSIQWEALLHGSLVGKIRVERPVLNFVNGPTHESSQTGVDSNWIDVVKSLMPVRINKFEINQGEIHFKDFHSNPKIDIYTKDVHILAENLSNAKHEKQLLPSTAEATAEVYGGKAKLTVRLNVLSKIPVFEAKAAMTGLDLAHLNNFLEAYGDFDVQKGDFSLFVEAATRNRLIVGYAKPIIKDLKVIDWKKDKDQPLKLAWKAIIGSIAWIFKNHPKDQLATRVDFEGRLGSPDTNLIEIIGMLLYNAFIQALYPSLENSISLRSVELAQNKKPKTFLGKLFNRSKKSKHKQSDHSGG